MFKRCEVCNIELGEHDFASHLQGKKHTKKIGSEKFKQDLIEKSVFVSRLPSGLQLEDIVGFFNRIGDVEKCKLEPNFAIIQFVKKEAVDNLLKLPIWMGRQKLEIKRRTLTENRSEQQDKEKRQDKEKTDAEIAFAELKAKLESTTLFDEELATFLESVLWDAEEVENNWRSVESSLVEALEPSFRNCEIMRFGSSVTGLSFKGSDFDIYLDIGQPIYDDNDSEKKLGWTPKKIFKEVKRLLFREKNVFEQIVLIPKAKTPIIKFCHAPTKTHCDLSFKNGLGVINSQLIKLLLNSDARLKPLMIIIKFWAKSFELPGCGKFTSYALVMLVIFYLQQPEVNILPAIVELQKTCEPEYHCNWQVNFDRTTALPVSENTSSLLELLHGLFTFYVSFPFEKMLIRPFFGRAHSRVDFAKVCVERGGDADRLALDRPICLQDPIELDNNITVGVSGKMLETFRSFCEVGVQVCQAALRDKEKPFLSSLFTTLPARVEEQAHHRITIPVGQTLKVGLPDDFAARTDIKDEKKYMLDNWFSVVQKLVEQVFKRVFKLEVNTVKNEARDAKQQKVEETSDVHSKDNDNIVLECTGSYCVMAGRKIKGFCIDPTLGQIDKEALISDELISKQEASGVKPTKISFTCTMLREENPVRLVLRLQDRASAKNRFRPLATYLNSKLTSIIDKELTHMLQYNKR